MLVKLIVGILIDIVFWILIIRWYRRRNKPVGAIVVTEREDGGILYSLELDDDPATLKDRKKVVFKIVRATVEDSS